MVAALANGILLAQQTTGGGKLPEPLRTMALMALLAIVLLGLLIVAITLLGGRWVRRWSEHRPGASIPPDLILKRPTMAESDELDEGELPDEAPDDSEPSS